MGNLVGKECHFNKRLLGGGGGKEIQFRSILSICR